MTDNTEDGRAAKAREIKAAYGRSWREKNREARAAYEKAYYAKNRDAVLEHKRRYREKNREKLREAARQYIRDENGELNAKYLAHKERIITRRAVDLETMAGRPRPEVCDACGGPPDPKRGLHYDHCHKKGHFRGWLCRECNLALGNVRDDPARLLKLVAYLKRTSEVAPDQFDLPGV